MLDDTRVHCQTLWPISCILYSPSIVSVTSPQLNLSYKKVKDRIAVNRDSHLTATGHITCHMGSHSVTCHPTQTNAPRLTPASRPVLDLPTPEGWKAELTWLCQFVPGLYLLSTCIYGKGKTIELKVARNRGIYVH